MVSAASILPGVRVSLSRERKILGTAGGPKKAAPFLESGTFLLLNGDFLIDIDLKRSYGFPPPPGGGGDNGPAGGSRLASSTSTPAAVSASSSNLERHASPDWTAAGFTGIHVLEPEVLKLIHANTPWEINLPGLPGNAPAGMESRRLSPPRLLARGRRPRGVSRRRPRGYRRQRRASIRPRPGAGELDPPGKEHTSLLSSSEKGPSSKAGQQLGPAVVIGPEVRVDRGAIHQPISNPRGHRMWPPGSASKGAIVSPVKEEFPWRAAFALEI